MNRIPIACSLDGGEARRRWLDWGALLAGRLSDERSDIELRVRFQADEAMRTELNRLVTAERECCGFVTWDIDVVGDEIVLRVAGETSAVDAIDEAFRVNE